jgi:UDP-N-acetylglucosamine acyltransferase
MSIHPTALVDPTARLGVDVEVGAYAFIGPQVEIGDGALIEHHANIAGHTTLGKGCRLWPYASLGGEPQDLKFQGEETRLQIGDHCQIREFVTMNRGTHHGGGVTRVGGNCFFMSYSHVAHDCQIGDHVVMANSATLAGHVSLGDHVSLGGLTAVHQFTRIGAWCFVGGLSGVAQDLPPFTLCEGNRAKSHGLNIVGLKRAGFAPETLEALKLAYRIIFRSRTPLQQALSQVRGEVPDIPEVRQLLDFIATSERGVAR